MFNSLLKNKLLIHAMLALSMLLASSNASAYLDPSTGSMVISAIVGLFASLALAIKTYWYRLKRLFRRDSRTAPSRSTDRPD